MEMLLEFHVFVRALYSSQGLVYLGIASSLARAKNGEAPSAHGLCMRLISPRCGDSGLVSNSSVSCVTLEFRLDI